MNFEYKSIPHHKLKCHSTIINKQSNNNNNNNIKANKTAKEVRK